MKKKLSITKQYLTMLLAMTIFWDQYSGALAAGMGRLPTCLSSFSTNDRPSISERVLRFISIGKRRTGFLVLKVEAGASEAYPEGLMVELANHQEFMENYPLGTFGDATMSITQLTPRGWHLQRFQDVKLPIFAQLPEDPEIGDDLMVPVQVIEFRKSAGHSVQSLEKVDWRKRIKMAVFTSAIIAISIALYFRPPPKGSPGGNSTIVLLASFDEGNSENGDDGTLNSVTIVAPTEEEESESPMDANKSAVKEKIAASAESANGNEIAVPMEESDGHDDANQSGTDFEQLEAILSQRLALGGTGGDRGSMAGPSFFGISTLDASSMIFVVDVSGSMSGEVVEVLKKQLEKAIDDLPAKVSFNIITFGSEASAFKPCLIPATQSNKDDARYFAQNLEVNGGTNMKDAIALTFSQHPQVVFLLTDGNPNDLDDTKLLLRRNYGRFTIHAIAIGSGANTQFLQDVATENQGQFVYMIK